MRTLYITRHAKSSWDDLGIRDHDRPLNDRGERDLPLMARRFAERRESLDLMVSSTAVRARSTATGFAHELAVPQEQILLRPALYLATVDGWLEVLAALPNDATQVMCFGHNPGSSDLVWTLTGEQIDLPTCATVRIDLDVDEWAAIAQDTGSLIWFDSPK
ncbi:MAG: histidine phosphatase family protein [Flavobacteriales bacterium]|nr:histidine phosphatase family protein [Flavobacteriales bacterium]